MVVTRLHKCKLVAVQGMLENECMEGEKEGQGLGEMQRHPDQSTEFIMPDPETVLSEL